MLYAPAGFSGMNKHLKSALTRYLREPAELCLAGELGKLEDVRKLVRAGVDIDTLVRWQCCASNVFQFRGLGVWGFMRHGRACLDVNLNSCCIQSPGLSGWRYDLLGLRIPQWQGRRGQVPT